MSFIENIFGNSFYAARRILFPNLSDRVSKLNLTEKNSQKHAVFVSLLIGSEFSVTFNPYPEITVINRLITLPQNTLLLKNPERVIRYLLVHVATLIREPQAKGTHELERRSQLLYPSYLEIKNILSSDEYLFCAKLLNVLEIEASNLEAKEAPKSFSANKGNSNNTAKAQSSPRVRTIDLNSAPDNPLVHMFEKVQTAEDYQGGNRSIEDAENLGQEDAALKEVLFSTVVRTNQTSSGLLETESSWSGFGQEKHSEVPSQDRIVFTREWFQKQNRYVDDWCQVFIADDRCGNLTSNELSTEVKALTKSLRERLEFIFNKNALMKRQRFGEDFDLDSLVRSVVELRVTRHFDDRVFLHRKKIEKDVGILFLVDTSMSTEAWIKDESGIDLLKKILFIIIGSLNGVIDNVQMDRFFSYTRRECHYRHIKTFNSPWRDVNRVVSNIAPEGYTRMGPAIRQAVSEFSSKKFRKKALFILSDCKPTDYDAYEGKHGNSDVRKAVLEAGSDGIVTHAFVITSGYSANAEKMFDKKRASFVSTPKHFADALYEILRSTFRGI